MVYEHIPWSIILDENASLEKLNRTPVVLLANAGILSDKEVDLLRRYVTAGGNLVVTGLTGCYDRMGRLLGRSSIEELIGAKFVGKLDSLDNSVQFAASSKSEDESKLRTDIKADWPFLVKGPAGVFEPISARTIGELLRPHRTIRQQQGKEGTEWPMSADSVVGPAVLLNRMGKGRVLTFTCSPDYATAGEHHIVEARHLLANAVRLLNENPRVRIKAPANVESIVTDEPPERTLRIHLLGYNSPPQTTPPQNRPFILPGLIEDAPMYRIGLDFKDSIKDAQALSPSTSLKRDGRKVKAVIDDIHEVIIVKY